MSIPPDASTRDALDPELLCYVGVPQIQGAERYMTRFQRTCRLLPSWDFGLGLRVGMFPLVLTVLNRDYSTPYYDPL